MKRVGYFAHTGEISGPNNSMRMLLAALDRREYEPVVYLPSAGPFADEVASMGVACRVVPMRPMQKGLRNYPLYAADAVRTTIKLMRLFKSDGIDLAHVNTCVTPYPGFAARLRGTPLIWHVRESLRRGAANDAYLRVITRLADHIVAVSESAAAGIMSRTGLAPSRISVIYNGIDLDGFDRAAGRGPKRAGIGAYDGDAVIAMPAFFLPHKGQEVLLRATDELINSMGIKNVRVLLIGEEAKEDGGAYTAMLKAYCRDNGLADSVKFLGLRRDVPALLAVSDVVCLPATYDDPLPRAVLEGMAAGKPVVGSDAGGIPEMIEHGRTGLVVPRGNPRELARALASLITDRALAGEMGRSGRLRARRVFNAGTHADRIQSVYARALNGGRRNEALENA